MRFGLETVPARVVSSESFCSEYAVTIAEGQILPPGVYPTQNITLPHGQYARERVPRVVEGDVRGTRELPGVRVGGRLADAAANSSPRT